MALLASDTKFGKYRIVRMIGRGGMATVYLAEDEMLGRQVALKVLSRAVTDEDRFLERFRSEARIVAGLRHPHIIDIYAIENVGEDWAIAMPYVDGGSLAQTLLGGPMPPHLAVHCMQQVLEALAVCHDSGIVHRDIKPSNILLTGEGNALLSDFGVAKLLAEHQSTVLSAHSSSGFFLGTPQYAPPESWDLETPTPAWDIYSVGMVLYKALSARIPYDAETPMAMMRQMLERPITPLAELRTSASPELSELVDRMLSQRLEDRPQSGAEALELILKTPEADLLRQGSSATLAWPKPARFRVLRTRGMRWFGERRLVSRHRILLTALLGLFAGGMFLARSMPGRAEFGTGDVAAPAVFTGVSTDRPWFFDTLDMQDNATRPDHGVIQAVPGQDGFEVLVAESTRVWYMRASFHPGQEILLEGHWAEYGDETARVFRHGTLSGKGQWIAQGDSLSATVDFRSAQDASHWARSMVFRRAHREVTLRGFMNRLVSSDFFLPILCNELIPRHLPWALDLEKMSLAGGGESAQVPRLGRNAIVMDGRLDEVGWRAATTNTDINAGMIKGISRHGCEPLLMRYGKEGLYLGIAVNKSMTNPKIVIAILDQVGVPLRLSSSRLVQFYKDSAASAQHRSRDRQLSWDCPWKTMSTATGERWTAEVFVPFENEAPAGTDRWRLTCAVYDVDNPDAPPVAYWGNDLPNAPALGAVLQFETGEDGPTHAPSQGKSDEPVAASGQ